MRCLVYLNQVAALAASHNLRAGAEPINEEPVKLLNDPAHVTALNATEWVPLCEKHVDKLLKTVDHAYTDVQLLPALKRECDMDATFTHYQDGFHDEDACETFAKELLLLRHKEIHVGESDYSEWCHKYFEHKWPTPVEEPAPPPEVKKPMVSYWWVLFVVLAAVLAVIAARTLMKS